MKFTKIVGAIMTRAVLFSGGLAVLLACGDVRADVLNELYVQDGLIAHWDAVDNAATGTHDPDARAWKDLVSGRRIILQDPVVVNDDRMTFSGADDCYGLLEAADTAATFGKAGGTPGASVEIVFASSAPSEYPRSLLQGSFDSGIAIGRIATDCTALGMTYSAAMKWTWDAAINTLSATWTSKVAQTSYVNGVSQPLSKMSSLSGTQTAVSKIGGRHYYKDSGYKGDIYAIRVYDRFLTEAERERNFQVDKMRREDPMADGCLQIVLGADQSLATCVPMDPQLGLSAGDTVTVSATSLISPGSGSDSVISCKGWKLYDLNGDLKAEGNESSFTYEHPGAYRKLVWQWDTKHRVTATCEDGGTVTNAEQWVFHGQSFNTLAQMADESLAFSRWVDANGETVGTSAALSLPVTQPMTLTGKCRGALYVAKNGNDANAGTSKAAPLLTIEAAIAKASSEGEGTLVTVGPGTYTATNTTADADAYVWAVLLDKARVAVVSSDGPSVTTIDAGTETKMKRAEAKVCAEGAFLSGFTCVNGSYSGKGKCSGVVVSCGAVSNCVISVREQWSASGANLSLKGTGCAYDIVIPPQTVVGGTSTGSQLGSLVQLEGSSCLDGLVITNFTYFNPDANSFFLRMGSYYDTTCVARNVLIADCALGNADTASLCSFVQLADKTSTLEDSTFANNRIYAGNGFINVTGSKPTIKRCIFWGNQSTSATNKEINGGANMNRFFSCCCKELTPGTVNENIASDPQFKNEMSGDYHLKSVSPAKEMGVVRLRPSGAAELVCAAEADVNTSAPGESLAVTFTGTVGGEQGDISATWDFGDGTSSTDWPTATHTYTTPGKYAVTLTVADESERDPATFAFSSEFTVVPLTCFVKEGGDGVYPYDTWAKATSNLAAAVEVGSRHVIVTNGVYTVPAPHISVGRAVSIVSVEGPSVTMVKTASDAAIDRRLFTCMNSDDILIAGFTMEGGYTKEYGWAAAVEMSSGALSNCVVRKTECVSRSPACRFGGTAKAVDCLFDGNGLTCANYDGMSLCGILISGAALLDRCEMRGYRIDTADQEAFFGSSPVSVRDTAILRNSLVHHCTNGILAKAQYRGVVTLLGGAIENCTIVDNTTGGYGGGIYADGGTVVNSIICGNHADLGGDDLYSTATAPQITYSCSATLTSGEGNVSNTNGLFTTRRSKPLYWLSPNSPAKNAGKNLEWMTAEALDRVGNPRVIDGRPDMGCYEVRSPGLMLMVR